jgi:hypothetical protein
MARQAPQICPFGKSLMKRINIELTAQELELALKLAKAAGYDSIEEFIRFTLRAEASKSATTDGSPQRNRVKRIDGELRRLRNELRGFLAESSLIGDASALASGSTHPQAATQLQLSLKIGSDGQQTAPTQPDSAPKEIGGQGSHQPTSQGIQLGYDRRAPGFKFNPEDELEDMAGAAFKNSPQLGAGSGTTNAATPAASEPQSVFGPDYPIEELVDDEPGSDPPVISASVPLTGLGIPKPPPNASRFAGVNIGAFFAGTVANLADELVASASDATPTQDGNESADNSNSNPLAATPDSQPVSITKVGGERKSANSDQGDVANEVLLGDTDDRNTEESQKASGENVSGESVWPDQIKSSGISGNLPPRKRKS